MEGERDGRGGKGKRRGREGEGKGREGKGRGGERREGGLCSSNISFKKPWFKGARTSSVSQRGITDEAGSGTISSARTRINLARKIIGTSPSVSPPSPLHTLHIRTASKKWQ